MIFATFDLVGTIGALGSLLVGIGTLGAMIDTRRRAKRLEVHTAQIKKTVDGVATAQRARTDRAESALHDAGLPTPGAPPGAIG